MKKILAILLSFAVIFCTLPFGAFTVSSSTSEYAGGSGTEDDPYLIETKYHLNNVRNHLDAHYKMISDIEFTATDFEEGGDFYNDGQGWDPIDEFEGTFDGNRLVIKNLYNKAISNSTATIYVGLFATNKGTIKGVGMCNSQIMPQETTLYGNSMAGGIVGRNYGTVINCYNWGAISASTLTGSSTNSGDSWAGGITGYNSGIIENCYNTGTISAFALGCADSGGITGCNDNNGIIYNCFNTGEIKLDARLFMPSSGGIVGYNAGTIINCYNTGTTSKLNKGMTGGITGIQSKGMIRNCYYLDIISDGIGSGSDTAVKCTYEQLKIQSTFVGFDFDTVWKISDDTYLLPQLLFSDHNHIYDNICDKVCNACSYTRTVNPHVYTNSCDTDCNICGYTRSITHTYDNTCDKECNVCSYARTVNPHEYTDSCDTDCNVCGNVREPEHDFVNGICTFCNIISENVLTYTIENGKIEITDCDTSVSGSGIIPSELGGYPVTSIGNNAFYNCTKLTNITIPDSVTNIDSYAFYYCTALKTVTIGNGVINIGDHAFYICDNLSTVTFGNRVESIGAHAFDRCSKLTNVSLPQSLINIGDSAFNSCKSLTSIIIPNNVTNIDKYAFGNCYNLESITFANGVTTIGYGAFHGCNVTVITIPDSVTSIGDYALSQCDSLTNIFVSENNQNYCSVDGVLFSKDKTILKQYPSGRTNTSYVIPDGVTNICEYAFDNYDLQSVTIPKSVISIANNAFGSYKLTDIYYRGSEEDKENISIGSYSFYSTNIIWHYSSCISSTEHTFDNTCDTTCNICGDIRVIEHTYDNTCDTDCNICGYTRTIIHIYDNACDKVCNVCGHTRTVNPHEYTNSCDTTCNICGFTRTIEHTYDNLCDDTECNVCGYIRTFLEPHAFDDNSDVECNNCYYYRYITYIVSNGEATVTGYTDDFSGKLTIPSTLSGYPVVSIGDSAFADCTVMTSIILPNTIKSIGISAFANCTGLTAMNIPGSVETIDSYAFSGCTRLIRVTLNEGTENIENNVFDSCENLVTITIPSTVKNIGTDAFLNCGDLRIVAIDDMTAWCEMSFENEISNPLYYATTLRLNNETVVDLTVPEDTTFISNYAFYNYSRLESVVFTDTVKYIGEKAFYNCIGLSEIDFGNGITAIGEYAFYNCESLTEVLVPDNITSIGYASFQECSSLSDLTIPFVGGSRDDNTHLGYLFGAGGYLVNDIYVPSSLKSVTVSDNCAEIHKYAFYKCQYIECLTLPFIGGSATENTYLSYIFGGGYYIDNYNLVPEALKKIVITDNCTTIYSNALYNCQYIEEIVIPESIVYAGSDAFYQCVSLNKVDITNISAWCNIDFINEYSNPVHYGDLYLNDELLTELTIPEEISKIKNYTFYNCSSLMDVIFGENLTEIGEYSFYQCTDINEVKLPDELNSIGDYAFYGCTNLTRLDTGNSLALIDPYAFYNSGLIDVFIGGNVVYIDVNAFGLCDDIACVYYAADSDMWDTIVIESGNDSLLNVAKKFNSSQLSSVGDLNGDGEINIIDLVRLKKVLVGSAESGRTTSDLDRNRDTNSADLIILRKFLLGAINDLKYTTIISNQS